MAELQDFELWPLTRPVDDTTTSTPGVVGPYSVGRPGQIGSVIGFWTDDARAGRKQTLQIDGVKNTPAVIPLEEWKNGDKLYWHQAGGVVTKQPTDAWLGWAAQVSGTTDIVKAAGAQAVNGYLMLRPGPTRDDSVLVTFDAGLVATLLTAAGPSMLVRNYSADSLAFPKQGTVAAQIIGGTFWHDGNLTPGTATLSLGTTAGGVDIMAATDLTTLIALGDEYTENELTLAAPLIEAPAVWLTVTVADITAGKFRIRLTNGW